MAEYIAATTDADATGADITVTDTPVKISFYGQDGGENVGQVLEKASDGSYRPLLAIVDDTKKAIPVKLSIRLGSFSLTAPGVYKIEKFVTTGTTGIDTTTA